MTEIVWCECLRREEYRHDSLVESFIDDESAKRCQLQN